MGYINQYNDSGTSYELHDARIEEIDSDDIGKAVIAYQDTETSKLAFKLSSVNTSQSTGNLSLNITTNTYNVSPSNEPWYKLIQWSNGYWYGALGSEGNSGGDVVRSIDGYTFTSVLNIADNSWSVVDIAGTKSALVASAYKSNTEPSIYYRGLNNGEETWTAVSLTDFDAGTRLDLLTGGDYIMAIPHSSSVSKVAITKNGISWTTISLTHMPTSNIIYDGVFEYVVFNATGNLGNVWKLDTTSNNFVCKETDNIPYYIAITGIKLAVSNGVVYQYVQSSSNTFLLKSETLSGDYTKIKSLATTTPSVANIQYFSVISNDLIVWAGEDHFYIYDVSQSTATSFTSRSIVFTGSVTTIPTTVFEFDNIIYATTGNLLYMSSDRGNTWQNGAQGYELTQINDGSNTDITRILVNLVKTDASTFKLSANEVGAITAPLGPTDGQIIQYNATTGVWEAVDMPASGGYRHVFTTSSWSSGVITVSAATHGCGINPIVDVYTLNGSTYEKYYGYASTGWKLTLDVSGNISLITATGSEFSGMLVIK